MSTIEEVHSENLRLIKLHKIKVGTYFTPIKKSSLLGGTVRTIHSLYGWITTTSNDVPQEVASILKLFKIQE